jgi:hypothetical protein
MKRLGVADTSGTASLLVGDRSGSVMRSPLSDEIAHAGWQSGGKNSENANSK